METKNGQVAWLSANTRRVYANYEDAVDDAQSHNYLMYNDNNRNKAYDDVYIVHLWLDK